MHVHVLGLMYLLIHLSFINVRLAMMLPQILLLSFLSLVHPLLQQYWLFLSHLSTDGHVPAPEKMFNIILQLHVMLEYQSFLFLFQMIFFLRKMWTISDLDSLCTACFLADPHKQNHPCVQDECIAMVHGGPANLCLKITISISEFSCFHKLCQIARILKYKNIAYYMDNTHVVIMYV